MRLHTNIQAQVRQYHIVLFLLKKYGKMAKRWKRTQKTGLKFYKLA